MRHDSQTLDVQVKVIRRRLLGGRIFVVVVLFVVVAAYSANFYGLSISKEPGAWGQFGDYVGGLLNPVVALFMFYWLTEQVRLTAELVQLERKEAQRLRRADRFATLYDEFNASAFHKDMRALGKWLDNLAKGLNRARTDLTDDQIAAAYQEAYSNMIQRGASANLSPDQRDAGAKERKVERARRRVKSWYVKCLLFREAKDLSKKQVFDLITRDRASLMLHAFAMTRGQTAASKAAAGAKAGSPSSDNEYFLKLEEMVVAKYGSFAPETNDAAPVT